MKKQFLTVIRSGEIDNQTMELIKGGLCIANISCGSKDSDIDKCNINKSCPVNGICPSNCPNNDDDGNDPDPDDDRPVRPPRDPNNPNN